MNREIEDQSLHLVIIRRQEFLKFLQIIKFQLEFDEKDIDRGIQHIDATITITTQHYIILYCW